MTCIYTNFQKGSLVFFFLYDMIDKTLISLKGLFHSACLARVVSWFPLVVAIYMAHENGDNKDQPRDDTCKDFWMKQTI